MRKYNLLLLVCLIGQGVFGQVNLDSMLIGYWPFSGNMLDASGFNNDGQNIDCVLGLDSKGNPDAAFEFNGNTSFAEIPASYEALTIPFTVTAWVLKSELQDFEHIFTTSSGVNTYSGIYLGVSGQGSIQVSYSDGGVAGSGSRRTKATDNGSVPLNEWVHIAAVVNASNDMDIYLNKVALEGDYSGSGGGLFNAENVAMIGRAGHNFNYWSGMIDEVRLYNRALSAEELEIVCDALSSVDSDPIKNSPFSIFPNPAREVLNLENNGNFKEYHIYDIQGQVVQNGQITSNINELDISNLSAGSYVIKLIGKEMIGHQIFVVSN